MCKLEPQPLSALFEVGPGQYGLRGDAELWKEMGRHLAETPPPPSAAGLEALLRGAFEALTGHSLAEDPHFYLAQYDRGGMSRGLVSPAWWRTHGIPLLVERYVRRAEAGPGDPAARA